MELTGHVFTIAQETQLFLGSCLLGVPLGMFWDGFRLLRTLLPHHWSAVFIEDTVFAAMTALVIECYGMMTAGGAVRYYYAAGALLGLALYLLTFGAVTKRMMLRFRRMRDRFGRSISRRMQRVSQKITGKFMKHHKNLQPTENLTENT